MKISHTNSRELVSAQNHILAARKQLSKVIDKLEKRNIGAHKIRGIYSRIWEASEEMYSAIDETEITNGGV
ncbi:MAG: hypothetical protein GWP06_06080 [Actinobacteria bacterium]|nr:hypothetical protein [Actinomycetota bacterium]